MAIILSGVLLISCEKSAKPEIDFHELGYENSKTVVAGEELHMDAEIVAEDKIDRIELELHPEGEHGSGKAAQDGHEWEFDTLYTKFSGLKNTHFHEHMDIPEDVPPGAYHFHLTVTDMEGAQASHEDEVEILAPENTK